MNLVEQALLDEEARASSFRFLENEEITKYRVSGFKSAEQCGTLYNRQYVGGNTRSQSGAAEAGTLCHLLLADIARGFAGRSTLLSGEDHDWIRQRTDELGENQTLANMYGRYLPRLMSHLVGKEILLIEEEVEIPNKHGMNIWGQVDLVLRDKSGKITAIDHKTARRDNKAEHQWRSDFQVCAYASAICTRFDVPEILFVIGMVNQEDDYRMPIKNSVAGMNLRIGRAVRNIAHHTEQSYRKSGDHCVYCPEKACCETRNKVEEGR